MTARRGQCSVCRYRHGLRKDRTLQAHHGWYGHEPAPQCEGTGLPPRSDGPLGGHEPGRIVVAGDWHGDAGWARMVIRHAAELLAGEQQPVVLQLGDFGVWPGVLGAEYLQAVRRECTNRNVRLLFIDGNHEDFTQIGALRLREDQAVSWLPRGYRWEWHGRTWLAMGGGVSLDKGIREEGRSWWPEEEITTAQEVAAVCGGRADVMVTHDCPAGVTHSFAPPPPFWNLRDLARNDAHRERLQRITGSLKPSFLMHGHLHRGYQRFTDFGYGPVQVTGLSRDGDPWNYAVLDAKSMMWEPAEYPWCDRSHQVKNG